MKFYLLFISAFCILAVYSCEKSDPNKDTHIEEVIASQHKNIDFSTVVLYDTTYVPIYSNIYNRSRDQTLFLTATLSIRNTSLYDTIFVTQIDYYNTKGDMIRKYLDEPIFLRPVESVDYVIDEQDNEGGSGANFVIHWCSKTEQVYPVFQAVMVGSNGQQGISFSTDGYSISRRAKASTSQTNSSSESDK